MAKRRKKEYEEGTVSCFYCGKPVYENSWRCPNCGKWFREGRLSILGIVAIIVIVIILAIYIVNPSFVFGEEEGETEPRYGVLIDVYPTKNKAEAGGYTEWGIHMSSLSNVADTIEFTTEGTQPLQVSLNNQVVGLGSGKEFLNVLRVDIPAVTPLGQYSFSVYATSRSDPTATDNVTLTVEVVTFSTRTVQLSDLVQCHYTLWTADEGDQRDNSYPRGVPLSVAVDGDNAQGEYLEVIPGFSNGLLGMKVGETKVAIVPPEDGYDVPTHELYGKTLIFQIELVSIDTA